MITITDIIISENNKKINEVLLHTKVNLKVIKSNINSIRQSIKLNHKLANNHELNVCFIYKKNENNNQH